MAATKGNEFWKLRSKHGRNKIFATPKIMQDACNEYFEHQNKQVWNRIDFKGKDSLEVKIPTSSPFTLTGLCIFLGINSVYFAQFEKKCNKDFSKVIAHVRDVIYTQKFEGATVGIYNQNIIARDLGLVDKKEFEIEQKLSPEEIKKELAELKEKLFKE